MVQLLSWSSVLGPTLWIRFIPAMPPSVGTSPWISSHARQCKPSSLQSVLSAEHLKEVLWGEHLIVNWKLRWSNFFKKKPRLIKIHTYVPINTPSLASPWRTCLHVATPAQLTSANLSMTAFGATPRIPFWEYPTVMKRSFLRVHSVMFHVHESDCSCGLPRWGPRMWWPSAWTQDPNSLGSNQVRSVNICLPTMHWALREAILSLKHRNRRLWNLEHTAFHLSRSFCLSIISIIFDIPSLISSVGWFFPECQEMASMGD